MLENYLHLRKNGYGIARSFKISFDDFVGKNFIPVPYSASLEIRLGEAVNNLEKTAVLDFQSLEDIVNNPSARGYRTSTELDLTLLHTNYCQNQRAFSKKLIKRYDSILKKLPAKFNELLNAIEKDNLREYENNKKALLQARMKDLEK